MNSVYIQDNWTPVKSVLVSVGLRYDAYRFDVEQDVSKNIDMDDSGVSPNLPKEQLPTSNAPSLRSTRAQAKLRERAALKMHRTLDSQWRNRNEFPRGRTEIVAFLTRKWEKDKDYRLIKELWSYTDNRIAVRFAYEWRDSSGQWYRSYGNENWEFDAKGLMQKDMPASMI